MSSRRERRVDETVSLGPAAESAPLALVVTAPGGGFTSVLPRRGSVRIGRSAECEVAIEDHSISRVHAVVRLGPPITLEDVGSHNGTIVLGSRVSPGERVPLPLGAVVQVGQAVLVLLRQPAEAPSTGSATSDSIVLASTAMRELFAKIEALAPSSISVLILGETGAGKEVVARAIHQRGPCAAGPFVALNCAALPESMIESELFGHAKGAFTGAVQAKAGLYEAAHAGTLFLDEIGDLSLTTQAKLLRVIETGEVTPLGTVRAKRVAVRLVAATNHDLPSLVQAGRFREDLYFRIQGVTIEVPPLRERTADVAPLVEWFARAVSARLGRPPPRFDPGAIEAMAAYAWPGNVRELKNVVERAVTLARGASVLGAEHLELGLGLRSVPPSASLTWPPTALAQSERDRYVDALARAGGNQTVAAKLVGVSRSTFIRRLEEFAIGRPRKGAMS